MSPTLRQGDEGRGSVCTVGAKVGGRFKFWTMVHEICFGRVEESTRSLTHTPNPYSSGALLCNIPLAICFQISFQHPLAKDTDRQPPGSVLSLPQLNLSNILGATPDRNWHAPHTQLGMPLLRSVGSTCRAQLLPNLGATIPQICLPSPVPYILA